MKSRTVFVALLLAAQIVPAASPSSSTIELALAGKFWDPNPVPASGSNWLALAPSGGGFNLVASRVHVEVVSEPCAGSITQVVAAGVKDPVFLVRGPSLFRPGPVDSVFQGHRFLNPGESVSFTLKSGDRFSLRAFGAVKPAQGGPKYTDYQIFMSGKGQTQVIADIPVLDSDAKPTLLWAGDLDRDDKLDVLLNLPPSYVSNAYALFLSSQAEPTQLVRNAATFHIAGC